MAIEKDSIIVVQYEEDHGTLNILQVEIIHKYIALDQHELTEYSSKKKDTHIYIRFENTTNNTVFKSDYYPKFILKSLKLDGSIFDIKPEWLSIRYDHIAP